MKKRQLTPEQLRRTNNGHLSDKARAEQFRIAKAIEQEERRQTARDILRQEMSFLKGDMAQQFNESQEDYELYDGQDEDGL